MAPDRPDASVMAETGGGDDGGGGGAAVAVTSGAGPIVTRVFGFCEAFCLKDGVNSAKQQQQRQRFNGLVVNNGNNNGATASDDEDDDDVGDEEEEEDDDGDDGGIVIEEEEIPMIKPEPIDDKSLSSGGAQSDDDLTSLSWLHQRNLLKGLDITDREQQQQQQLQQQLQHQHPHPVRLIKAENILNNNVICEDSLDISENTDSVSSIEDGGYSPESNGKTHSLSGNALNYHDLIINGKQLIRTTQDFAKITNNGATQNYQIKHYNNNNNNNNNHHNNNNNNNHQHHNNNINNNINNGNINANFNLPGGANRGKHPHHLPYDPYVHKNSKPPYSFSCLIFMAIEDSPLKALPVKEVYAWILEHFPYFRNAPTGWKNSVRHNLSLNKCFRKVEKSPNLGKGSLWMVDPQYRPNLIQALSRSPFPIPTTTTISSTPETVSRKIINTRLPDPVLFPYLSKRLASSNIGDNSEVEFDSDVDAAAAAMLSFKHGPIILNHNNKEHKKKNSENSKMVQVITRSSTEDHTYSLITAVRVERRIPADNPDVDEQRKIAEGADALLNLAGVNTTPLRDPLAPDEYEEEDSENRLFGSNRNAPPCAPGSDPLEIRPFLKRRSSDDDESDKQRKRPWRDTWAESGRYIKQVRG